MPPVPSATASDRSLSDLRLNKMEYCIENNVRAGLSLRDIRQATSEALAEHRAAKHHEELQEFAEVHGAGRAIVSVTRSL